MQVNNILYSNYIIMTSLWNRMVYNQKDLTTERVNSWDDMVKEIRERFVSLIDDLDYIRGNTEDWDVKRLASIAISKLEEACMFSIKTLMYNK